MYTRETLSTIAAHPRWMPVIHDKSFETLPIRSFSRGPYYLWVDESHPLAQRDFVKLTDLEGCRFIFPSSVRYQGLEGLITIAKEVLGINVESVFWPGKYEECIMGINSAEVMVVNGDDLRDPAYSLVEHRKTILIEDFETLVKPCFVYMKDNDNPALEALRDFVLEEDGD